MNLNEIKDLGRSNATEADLEKKFANSSPEELKQFAMKAKERVQKVRKELMLVSTQNPPYSSESNAELKGYLKLIENIYTKEMNALFSMWRSRK